MVEEIEELGAELKARLLFDWRFLQQREVRVYGVRTRQKVSLQIAERALAEKPSLKVIITSGYNTGLADLEKLAAASIIYLPKPCSLATLTSVIDQCLRGRRVSANGRG